MQRINDFYYAWCAAAADFNHDGILDIVAGPYYSSARITPKRKEIYPGPDASIPPPNIPMTAWQAFAYDFTGDGWPDVLCMGAIGQPLHLYVNPKGESRALGQVRGGTAPVSNEVSLLKDIDGDGKPE